MKVKFLLLVGLLAGGISSAFASKSVEVYTMEEGLVQNDQTNQGDPTLIKQRIVIKNTGTEAVSNIKWYYYFTADANTAPQSTIYWAPNCTVNLVNMNKNNEWRAEYQYTGTIAAGTQIPANSELSVAITNTDNNKTNDYSYNRSSTLSLNSKMPVYEGSSLVGGTDPYSGTQDVGTYDLLIVTTNKYLPAAQRLAAWKEQLGFKTAILSKPVWDNANITVTIGFDSYSKINSSPIRKAIEPYYKNGKGISYLLIMGSEVDVPPISITNPAHIADDPDANTQQTDLFYAYYTPVIAAPVFTEKAGDVAYSRMYAESLDEAYTIVNKGIVYEKAPSLSPDYYKQFGAIVTTLDPAGYLANLEEQIDFLKSKSYNELYYVPNTYNTKQYNYTNNVLDVFNRQNFLNIYRGHGYPDMLREGLFRTSDIKSINNQANAIDMIITCGTGTLVSNGLAVNLLRAQDKGAVGVIAASQFKTNTYYNNVFIKELLSAIWPATGQTPEYCLSKVLQYAKVRALKYFNAAGSESWECQSYNFFGDPTLEIRTQLSYTISANYAKQIDYRDLTYLVSNIKSNGTILTSGKVTLSVNNQKISTALITTGGTARLSLPGNLTVGSKLTICVYSHNGIPLIDEIEVINKDNISSSLPIVSLVKNADNTISVKRDKLSTSTLNFTILIESATSKKQYALSFANGNNTYNYGVLKAGESITIQHDKTFNATEGDYVIGIPSTLSNYTNQAPLALNGQIIVTQNQAGTFEANASDIDGSVVLVETGNPSHGSATIVNKNLILYTPTFNYIGTDLISYRVKDNEGVYSAWATIAVTVKPKTVYQQLSEALVPYFAKIDNDYKDYLFFSFGYTSVQGNLSGGKSCTYANSTTNTNYISRLISSDVAPRIGTGWTDKAVVSSNNLTTEAGNYDIWGRLSYGSPSPKSGVFNYFQAQTSDGWGYSDPIGNQTSNKIDINRTKIDDVALPAKFDFANIAFPQASLVPADFYTTDGMSVAPVVNGSVTLNPGVYKSIELYNNANLILKSGVYCFEGFSSRSKETNKISIEQEGSTPVIIFCSQSYLEISVVVTKGDATKVFWYMPNGLTVGNNVVGRFVSPQQASIYSGQSVTGQVIALQVIDNGGVNNKLTSGTQTVESLLGNKDLFLDRSQTANYTASGYTLTLTAPQKQTDILTIDYTVPSLLTGSNMLEFVVYTPTGDYIKGIYNEIFAKKSTLYAQQLGAELLPGKNYYLAVFHNGTLIARRALTVQNNDVRFVRSNAASGGNGQSWATAYKCLQDALTDVKNSNGTITEVRVAAGTYYPDLDEKKIVVKGNVAESFKLYNGLTIKGGYPANGGLEKERHTSLSDASRNVTVLSGDLTQNGALRSYNVVNFVQAGATAVLDGIDITMGRANGSSGASLYGGAIYASAKQLSIQNAIIQNNSSQISGGAIYADKTIISLVNAKVANNTAGAYGGAMFYNTDNLTIKNCTFDGNTSSAHGASLYQIVGGAGKNHIQNTSFINGYCGGAGGAIYAEAAVDLQIENCNFIKNKTNSGIGGAAIYYSGTKPFDIYNSIFSENTVPSGSGYGACFDFYTSATISIDNCLFNKNSAYRGGVACVAGSPVINVTYSTFYGNNASLRGACFDGGNYTLNIKNSILWANTSYEKIVNECYNTPTITNTCFEGGNTNDGNQNTDPFFVNTADADGADNIFRTNDDGLQLNDYSLCVDHGTDEAFGNLLPAGRPFGLHDDLGAYELVYATKRPIIKVVADATNKRFIITSNVDVDPNSIVAKFSIKKYDASSYTAQQSFGYNPVNTIYVSDVDFGDQITLTDNASYVVDPLARTASLPMQYKIRYVDKGAAANGDGKTWATAYQNLQDAVFDVSSSKGDIYEIQIAEGTYRPDEGKYVTKGSQSAVISLTDISLSNVAILGGFPKGGAPKSQRNPQTYKTIIDGNINNAALATDNSVRLFDVRRTTKAVSFDGITFTGNYGDYTFALYAEGVDAINITQCNFVRAASGVYVSHSTGTVTVKNCTFDQNTSLGVCSALGVYEVQQATTVDNCTFSNNSGSVAFDASMFYGTLDITNSKFLNNNSQSNVGSCACSITAYTAGAITISHSSFIGNRSTAGYGGAIYAYISNNPFTDARISDCMFAGNYASQYGGAIFSRTAYLKIYSSTFVGNYAGTNGGAIYLDDYGHTPLKNTEIRNSIIWKNISTLSNGKDQIYWTVAPPMVNTSCIQDAVAGDASVYVCPAAENNLNIDTDPLFVANGGWDAAYTTWTNGDYRLTAGSKCIDGSLLTYDNETTDLAGNPRITGRYLDMGAYEGTFAKPQIPGLAIYQYEQAMSDNTISKPLMYIANTGTSTISDFVVYYYFTVENGKTPAFDNWNTPNSTESLEDLGNGNYRIVFNFKGYSLAPSSRIPATGEMQFGLHYADYSAWDKSNDYSNNLKAAATLNQAIPIYSNATLVYGIEPTLNQSVLKSETETTSVTTVTVTEPELSIAPNPMHSQATITVSVPENCSAVLTIISSTGQVAVTIPMSCVAGSNTTQIDESMLPMDGMYVIRCVIDSQQTLFKRFVKIQ